MHELALLVSKENLLDPPKLTKSNPLSNSLVLLFRMIFFFVMFCLSIFKLIKTKFINASLHISLLVFFQNT